MKLNATLPMELRPDGKNLPKAMVVFECKFQTGDEWHNEEKHCQWHPDVAVSFQPNAWVDIQTHIHGLAQLVGI